MSLSPQFLDELRHRTSLSALIGRSTKLQKAGHEFRACCPFHNEKTPSFYVNDDKGFYHCFGCSAHGDAIRWMTDQRGLSFIDAVRELADGAGMELPAIDRASAQRSEQARGIHDACAAAAAWFGDQLGAPGGAAARAMLDARGITAASITTFGLGFAPDARGRLRSALSKLGDALLIESGLLIAGRADAADQSPYDRFRGRIMIPIRDARGRPIAFGGRVITSGGSGGADGGATAEPGAKYLNSPESPLFSKGQTLFNLDLAAPAARRRGRVIVVEGYLDVIALAQAGIAEVVAPLGTALTETQLEMLWRMSDVPLLCFDGDAAGRKAGLRAAHRALAMLAPGRSLALVMLPPGRDPDDIVRNGGAAAIEAIIAAAEPLVDRLWNEQLASAPLATPEQRAGLRQRLTELAQTIGDASVRSEYLAEFRRRLDGLRPQPVAVAPFRRRDVRAGGWNIPPAPVTEAAKSVGAGGIDRILAKAVLAGLIRHPGEIGRHVEVLSQLKLADDALGRLFGAVVDLALEDQALDHTRLRTILAGSGFDALATELLRADQLSFSFTINDTEPRRAHEDLDEAIAILVARPEVDAALAAATLALQTVGRDPIELPGQTPAPAAGGTIDEAFARQVALVREQQALAARLANLVQANEDARSDEIEGR